MAAKGIQLAITQSERMDMGVSIQQYSAGGRARARSLKGSELGGAAAC